MAKKMYQNMCLNGKRIAFLNKNSATNTTFYKRKQSKPIVSRKLYKENILYDFLPAQQNFYQNGRNLPISENFF